MTINPTSKHQRKTIVLLSIFLLLPSILFAQRVDNKIVADLFKSHYNIKLPKNGKIKFNGSDVVYKVKKNLTTSNYRTQSIFTVLEEEEKNTYDDDSTLLREYERNLLIVQWDIDRDSNKLSSVKECFVGIDFWSLDSISYSLLNVNTIPVLSLKIYKTFRFGRQASIHLISKGKVVDVIELSDSYQDDLEYNNVLISYKSDVVYDRNEDVLKVIKKGRVNDSLIHEERHYIEYRERVIPIQDTTSTDFYLLLNDSLETTGLSISNGMFLRAFYNCRNEEFYRNTLKSRFINCDISNIIDRITIESNDDSSAMNIKVEFMQIENEPPITIFKKDYYSLSSNDSDSLIYKLSTMANKIGAYLFRISKEGAIIYELKYLINFIPERGCDKIE